MGVSWACHASAPAEGHCSLGTLEPLQGSLYEAAVQERVKSYTLHLTPYTLHHITYTPHPTLYTIQPTLHTLHPTPSNLHPTPYTLHPTPYNLHPTPYTLHHTTCTLHPVRIPCRMQVASRHRALVSCISRITCSPFKAVTLPNIGVPQYIGVPPPTYLPTLPHALVRFKDG